MSATVTFGFLGSLLVTVSRPEVMVPKALGLIPTVTLLDAPGAIVNGVVAEMTGEPTMNPGGAETEVTVSGAVPVSLRVRVKYVVWPTGAVPKSREAGLTPMAGTGAGSPVPLSATVTVG